MGSQESKPEFQVRKVKELQRGQEQAPVSLSGQCTAGCSQLLKAGAGEAYFLTSQGVDCPAHLIGNWLGLGPRSELITL